MEVQTNSSQSETEANNIGGMGSPLLDADTPHGEDGPQRQFGIDPLEDELLTLAEAAAICPKVNGKRPRCSTIWRWCKKGTQGIKLAYVKIGSRIMTTRPALLDFFERSKGRKVASNSTGSSKPKVRSDKRRERERQLAWQRLKRHGL